MPIAGLDEQPACDQEDGGSDKNEYYLPGSFLLSRDKRQVLGQWQIALQKCKRAGKRGVGANLRATAGVRQFVPAALRNRQRTRPARSCPEVHAPATGKRPAVSRHSPSC